MTFMVRGTATVGAGESFAGTALELPSGWIFVSDDPLPDGGPWIVCGVVRSASLSGELTCRIIDRKAAGMAAAALTLVAAGHLRIAFPDSEPAQPATGRTPAAPGKRGRRKAAEVEAPAPALPAGPESGTCLFD